EVEVVAELERAAAELEIPITQDSVVANAKSTGVETGSAVAVAENAGIEGDGVRAIENQAAGALHLPGYGEGTGARAAQEEVGVEHEAGIDEIDGVVGGRKLIDVRRCIAGSRIKTEVVVPALKDAERPGLSGEGERVEGKAAHILSGLGLSRAREDDGGVDGTNRSGVVLPVGESAPGVVGAQAAPGVGALGAQRARHGQECYDK